VPVFLLSYHSTQNTDGFWYRLVKDNFKGKNAKKTFNFKIYMILLQKKKKEKKQTKKKTNKPENVFFSAKSINCLERDKNCIKATYHKSSKHEIGYSISLVPILHAMKRSMN